MERPGRDDGTKLPSVVDYERAAHVDFREGLPRLLTVADYERAAENLLAPEAFAGLSTGAGDETTLRDNRAAFGRWILRPRMLVDVSQVSTKTDVLGASIAQPLIIAPTAGHCQFHSSGESATARAAAAAGTILCLSGAASLPASAVVSAAPTGRRWLQLTPYRNESYTTRMLEYAVAHGFEAIVLTVDTPFLGGRDRAMPEMSRRYGLIDEVMGNVSEKPGPELLGPLDASFTWRRLRQLVRESQCPILVKGILTGEDAALACDHGVAGVIVSNHGARQLDGGIATLDALPEVVEAVGGRVEIFVDGGVRRGTDVVKALALGARAVLVGRPPIYGLAVDGEAGVRHVLQLLEDETRLALALLGCTSPEAVTRAHVRRHPTAPPLDIAESAGAAVETD